MLEELVTIITPSYNSKKYIKATIDSVYMQSYSNFEMIIVDDSSSDGSADYISDILPDNRFRLIQLKENVGAAEARNVALKESKGRYIAFLDSDDTWYPQKLEKQLAFMKAKDVAFSFTSYEVVDEGGKIVKNKISVPNVINRAGYLGNTIIGCLTVIIDRYKIKKDLLMPNLRSSHDMALWADVLEDVHEAYGLNEVLASYRLVGTSNTSNKFKAAKEVWLVYREYLKLNIFLSFYYFSKYSINALIKRF
ncbi:glycosyl transferase [Shewanella algae]|uniref:glycosyltransferase family 2 protein n=1 Tax=Shewanella TaxID=22 RepID=UPI0011B496FD|nr:MULTISPECIES: glycosyltransferase family 2 protein [Shewanella]MCK7630234.1 glycosyltransferase [Shewanella sp. JNE9-1]MCK7653394.1 glycosyltransferase [Shewanella sp. JNE4-1]TWU69671.1 glycosyl transferase [Shewanella algae]